MSVRLPKHLHDALTACERAAEFCSGLTLAQYCENRMAHSAVERQLEILGEACRRAPDEDTRLRERIPGTALAIALRNRIIHGYDRVEHEIVFDTVQRDLPPMMAALREELKPYASGQG